LVIYRLMDEESGGQAEPIVRAALPGSAQGWTPALDQCLQQGGRYAWSVRAIGAEETSAWSTPALFQVAVPILDGFEQALAVVRSYLTAWDGTTSGAGGVAETEAAEEPNPEPTTSTATPLPRAAAPTALSVDQGIAAASFAGDGSALTDLDASNLASGTVATGRGGTGIDSSGVGSGSVLYTSATGTWSTLPSGSNGQVLKVSGDAPAWGTDSIGGTGTVTQLSQGTGIILTPTTLTTTGSISVDTAVIPRLASANTFTMGLQTIETGSAATTGLVVKGSTSQTANLQEWQDDSGTPLAAVAPSGSVVAASFSGAGSGLTALNATHLSSGTTPSGRLSGTYDISITGTASNLTGTAAVANGGTGAVSAAGARANLGAAPATGSTSYVTKGGDTMTGTLNLPSDGLTVGGSQLSLSGGNLGIGTVPPGGASDPILTMARFLNGSHLVATIENTAPFSAAALRLKTPAAGNEWNLAAQETGAGAARGLEVQNASFATPPMSISAATGFVGINNLSPANRLDVKGDIRIGTGTTGCVRDADATAIAGTCSSDVRLKKNIKPLANLLARITQLRPVHFNWRSEEFAERVLGKEAQLGLIAQEVERVLPELVAEGDDGFKQVRYSDLPFYLLQALKEQQQENDALQETVRDLAKRLHALEK
jgi:hypothetical protein